jgi:hypothetical protein
MNQEARYLAALQNATSFTLASNQLLIGTRNGLLVFYNSPAPLQPIAPPQLPPVDVPVLPTVIVPTLEPTDVPIAGPTVEVIETATPTEMPIAQPTVEIVKTATPTPLPPAGVITAPTQGTVDQAVKFDASSSTSGGTITGYAWDFGDGTKGTGKTVEHKYTKAGTFTVTLTVTDSYGKTDTTTQTITIK